MRTAQSVVALIGTILFAARAASGASYSYSFLDNPLGSRGTALSGIDGNIIVGTYQDANQQSHGFVYNGTSFTTLDDPLGSTEACDVSGNKIVGNYRAGNKYHGFVYDGSTYTTIDHPLGALNTTVYAIDGNLIVGNYQDSNGSNHGFIFDGSTFTTIATPPGYATGISGNTVVGEFNVPDIGVAHYRSYTYSGSTFTPLPGSDGYLAYGIDGNLIVGSQIFEHGPGFGFLYDGSTYTRIDPITDLHIQGQGSSLQNISGNRLVGNYSDPLGRSHGFIVTLVPEPASISLVGFAGLILVRSGITRRLRIRN